MAPRRDIETLFSVNTEDFIRPFAVPALGLRGRTVRLGPLVDAVLDRHAYPVPVARLIAEALALTALLGSSLKFDGRFVIQSQSDGPVSFLVADYFGDGDLRAYCRFDAERVAAIHGEGRLLGTGHLAFTVDQGEGMKSYQGIVPLEGHTLADTAETYFRQSEQIPTRIALAAGEILQPGTDGAGSVKGWRAGGLFVQHLPGEGGDQSSFGDPEADPVTGFSDDAWAETCALVDTIGDAELIDPTVSADTLLFRLFHERGVRVFDPQPVRDQCRCSNARIEAMLAQFSPEDVADMTVDGSIFVKCEFCAREYRYDPADFAA